MRHPAHAGLYTSRPGARGGWADLLRARGHGGCRLQAPLLGQMGNQAKGAPGIRGAGGASDPGL